MDIAAISMALSQNQIRQDASLAIMDKSLGNMKSNGNGLIQMLEQSTPAAPHPTLGNVIDFKG